MRSRMAKVTAFCLSAGLVLGNAGIAFAEEASTEASAAAAETEVNKDAVGTVGFAECDESTWVNVRAEASTETGEVIGVLKNHDSAEIEDVDENGWYKIKSGDLEGYVAGYLLKTGEEADAIAKEVAYNYAINHATELNVRADASEEADVVTSLLEGEEAEVVDETDNWYKVCLDPETYGYVSKDYVEYKTAYPTGETIDELMSEIEAADTVQEDASAETAPESEAAETAETDTPETYAPETDTPETDTPETWAPETDTPETWAPETDTPETWVPETDTPETDTPETWAPETDTPETDTPETWAPETDTPETWAPETDTPETWAPETESPETSAPETEAPQTESPSYSGVGQSVVGYAAQFVGNPYVWGGSDPNTGADCSGFTQYVYAHFGVSLAHYTGSQMYSGTSVSLDQLQPGDLVFYSYSSYCDHVAIYAGNGAIIHAANQNAGICWGSLGSPIAAVRLV